MGCDIHAYSEKRVGARWVEVDFEPFDCKLYDVFAFLAGVRNYSGITPISEPRGIPKDSLSFGCDVADSENYNHSGSWLSVKELTDFDYSQEVEDLRAGRVMTFKEFLGESFFKDLDTLVEYGVDRVVFWFDE